MRIAIWFFAAAAGLAAFWALFTFTVAEGEFAVVTRFGKPVQIVSEPGFHLRYPAVIQAVNRFDKRIKVYETRLVEQLTSDKKNLILKFHVLWRIVDPELFFLSLRDDTAAEEKLGDIVASKSGAALGEVAFEDLISLTRETRIAELEQRVAADVSQTVREHYGVEIVEVGLTQLALPEMNAKSVYRRMRAEREAIAKKYRAEGKEEAAKIRAKAERERGELLATARRDAQLILAEGEEEAARIAAETFGKDPEFYRFWRSMETYSEILDKKTTLVLSQDSELFKYLER